MPNQQCDECKRDLEVGMAFFTINIGSVAHDKSLRMLPLTEETGGRLVCLKCAPKAFGLTRLEQIERALKALHDHVWNLGEGA